MHGGLGQLQRCFKMGISAHLHTGRFELAQDMALGMMRARLEVIASDRWTTMP